MYCTKCGSEVQPADRFCGNCGSRLERTVETKSPETRQPDAEARCASCGHVNPAGVAYCEACGVRLPGGARQAQNRPKPAVQQKQSGKSRSFIESLQSWKVTVGIAVVFVVVFLVTESSRREVNVPPTQEAMGPEHTQAMLAEIDQLQKRVDSSPGDLESTLRLANLLHDVRFFPRAIAMYQRYLKSNPSNADARVDMGICYFEMALSDSANTGQDLDNARAEMQKALTYSPRHQLAHFNLGIVSLRSGNMEAAGQWFRKCIDIDPNSETGKRAQELLSQHQFTNKP